MGGALGQTDGLSHSLRRVFDRGTKPTIDSKAVADIRTVNTCMIKCHYGLKLHPDAWNRTTLNSGSEE